MFAVIIFAALVASADCGLSHFPSINETSSFKDIATKEEFPWVVSVKVGEEYNEHICSGAILNEDTIVTVANCLFTHSAYDVIVVAGEYNLEMKEKSEQRIEASNIYVYLGYDDFLSFKILNDIAVIKLQKRLNFTKYVQPICLPKQEFTGECVAVGWMRRHPGPSKYLQKIFVPLVSDEECRKAIRPRLEEEREFSADHMLCTGFANGNEDFCQSDLGAPLICEDGNWQSVLVGLYIWGCGYGSYAVNTQVSHFKGWIEAML